MTKLCLLCALIGCTQASMGDDDSSGTGGGGGAGTGSGTGSQGGSGGTGGTSVGAGVIVDIFAGTVEHYDLAADRFSSVDIFVEISDELGTNGTMLLEFYEDSFTSAEDTVDISFRNNTAELEPAGVLPTFSLANIGFITSSIQPSPDGHWFAMPTHEEPDLDTEFNALTVFDAQMNVRTRVMDYREPIWLDNDHLIVHDATDLWIMDLVGSTVTRIGPAGLGRPGETPLSMSLSPDRRSVAYEQDGEIWRIDLDGANLVQLTARSFPQHSPTWSPDGQTIAFVFGDCPNDGIGLPQLLTISSTMAMQDAENAPGITVDKRTIFGCGPYFWLPR